MSRDEAISEMLQYFDEKALVGLFWYHPIEEDLFEVHSIPVTSLKKHESTYPRLHKTIWQELRFRTKSRIKKGLSHDPIYLEDYTKVPRGRVFFQDGKFYIFVGSWITDKIKKQIIKHFNLQKCEVIFKIDRHWEIGHGWSSEKDILNFE